MSQALHIVLFVLGYIAIGLGVYSFIYVNIDQMEGWHINDPLHVIPSIAWPLALLIAIAVGVLFFPLKGINKLINAYTKFLRNKRQTKKALAWKKKNDAEFKKRHA